MGKSLIELKIKNYYREEKQDLGPCYVNNNYNYIISKNKINNNMVQSSTEYYRDKMEINNFDKDLNLYFLQQYSSNAIKNDRNENGIININSSKVYLNHTFIENYDDIKFRDHPLKTQLFLNIYDSKVYNINTNRIFNYVYINKSSIEHPIIIKALNLKLYRITDFKEITVQSGGYRINLDIDINYKDPQYLLNNIKVVDESSNNASEFRVNQIVLRNLGDNLLKHNKLIEITKDISSNLALKYANIIILNYNEKDEINLEFEELDLDHLTTLLDKGEYNKGKINLYIKKAYIQNNYCSHRCTKCNFFIENLFLDNSEGKLFIENWFSCSLDIKNVFIGYNKQTSFPVKNNTKNTNNLIFQGKTYKI